VGRPEGLGRCGAARGGPTRGGASRWGPRGAREAPRHGPPLR
jgi:hypothetical protein